SVVLWNGLERVDGDKHRADISVDLVGGIAGLEHVHDLVVARLVHQHEVVHAHHLLPPLHSHHLINPINPTKYAYRHLSHVSPLDLLTTRVSNLSLRSEQLFTPCGTTPPVPHTYS